MKLLRTLTLCLAAVAATVAWTSPASANVMCNGKVTEVTVTLAGTLSFRHTGMSAYDGELWITACDIDTDGPRCEAWHRTLTAGVLSGKTVTVRADKCRTSTAVSPVVSYIKLRD